MSEAFFIPIADGGTGRATSVLHDEDGVVGTGTQTLLISSLAGTR